jgi:predicted dehydrogenase
LNNQHELQLCLDDGSGGDVTFTTLTAPDDQPSQMQTFVNLVRGDAAPDLPDLAAGVRCQAVLDAILESAGSRRWVSL